MCLAIPGRIVRIDEDTGPGRTAEVAYGALRRSAQLLYVPEARVGDYIIVQAGFALRTVGPEEAEECLRAAEELASLPTAPGGLPPGSRAVPGEAGSTEGD